MGSQFSTSVGSSEKMIPLPLRKFVKDRSHGGSKFICLHGWRTSGEILRCQTAAFRAHVRIDCDFPDAPFRGQGPPDSGIATYYPDHEYYEWYLKTEESINNIDESINYIINFIKENGPYDGILGFSQGAAFSSMIVSRMESDPLLSSFCPKCCILIGGVCPPQSHAILSPIFLPSLHLMGKDDPFLRLSHLLKDACYDVELKTEMIHEEAHNIPSIRTGIYPQVKAWIERSTKEVSS